MTLVRYSLCFWTSCLLNFLNLWFYSFNQIWKYSAIISSNIFLFPPSPSFPSRMPKKYVLGFLMLSHSSLMPFHLRVFFVRDGERYFQCFFFFKFTNNFFCNVQSVVILNRCIFSVPSPCLCHQGNPLLSILPNALELCFPVWLLEQELHLSLCETLALFPLILLMVIALILGGLITDQYSPGYSRGLSTDLHNSLCAVVALLWKGYTL